jgi:hypothetical protein
MWMQNWTPSYPGTRAEGQLEGDEFQVAKRYFTVDPQEQFQYRDELYTLAYGDDEETLKKYLTPDWHEEMYLNNPLTESRMGRDGTDR